MFRTVSAKLYPTAQSHSSRPQGIPDVVNIFEFKDLLDQKIQLMHAVRSCELFFEEKMNNFLDMCFCCSATSEKQTGLRVCFKIQNCLSTIV